jgi:hypothetical protein
MSVRQKKKAKQDYFIGATLVLIVSAVIVYFGYAILNDKSIPLGKDGCPKDRSLVNGQTIFLIDKTDRLSKTQKDSVEVDIKNRINGLPEYHQVSIFAISSDLLKSGDPILNLCSPRKFDSARDKEFSTGKDYLETQFERKFKTPIMEATKSLIESQPDKNSPIFEMLQFVKINGIDRSNLSTSKKQNLIIYSDLLHHTDSFTLYQINPSYSQFINSNYAMKAVPNLRGIEVSFQVFISRPEFQKEPLIKFWRELVKDRGGLVAEVNFIQG